MKDYLGMEVKDFMEGWELNSEMLKKQASRVCLVRAKTPKDLMGSLWECLACPKAIDGDHGYCKDSPFNYIWMPLDNIITKVNEGYFRVNVYFLECKESERYAYLELGEHWINRIELALMKNADVSVDDVIFDVEKKYANYDADMI